jgi:hypothetical protein
MLSPDASGLLAQMRPLADLAKPLLAVSDQLLGDVWMCGKHWILLRIVVLVGWLGRDGGRGRARSVFRGTALDSR